jgi:microcystin-dependent protein
MNKQIIILSGLGVLVLVLVLVTVLIVKKEKFETGYTPSATDNGAMVADVNGNISLTASLPIFSIISWYSITPSSPAPNGWCLCNGQKVTVLGKEIAAPNLNGRFLVGGNTAGTIGGSSQAQLNSRNLPFHAHNTQSLFVDDRSSISSFSTGQYENVAAFGSTKANAAKDGKEVKTELKITTACAGNEGGCLAEPFNIIPLYCTVVYIMKIA